ncbi:MAG: Kae1-associated serine/threonine protein kinase [Deltaproteobacteria bacterium]|nr:Kae1-associated serine/threonine protein kinase [Deltaproteobacteria bacterium]
MKEVARGAEAVLRKDGDKLIKDRVKKGYRLKELDDKIRSQRTKREEGLLVKAKRAGVNAPTVWSSEKNKLVMEWIDGKRVKEALNEMNPKERETVYKGIGEALGKLHTAGIVHGDVTTSNMILKDGKVFVIDFGLGKTSKRIEDYAVDLYVLMEALKAAHFKILDSAWAGIVKAYKYNNTNAEQVLKRFQDIDKRRRYRSHD